MGLALISHPDCLLHDTGAGHPECSARIHVISEALAASSLAPFIHDELAPMVTLEQLCRVHDEAYIRTLINIAPKKERFALDSDTLMSPATLQSAFFAAGAAVKGVDLVLSHSSLNGAFCNIRPPGHHAEPHAAMGFCFFNNVAVGVAHAIEHHHLDRIAIIDFDVHRGNGTEAIFVNHKKVLMCSIYEENLYPFSPPPKGAHNIIDIPLQKGTTGSVFRAEIMTHALHRIRAFKPQLIFFSAGFDGHANDPISNINLKESDYLWITQQIKEIAELSAQNRMVSVLEGGYALEILGPCVVAHLSGWF